MNLFNHIKTIAADLCQPLGYNKKYCNSMESLFNRKCFLYAHRIGAQRIENPSKDVLKYVFPDPFR